MFLNKNVRNASCTHREVTDQLRRSIEKGAKSTQESNTIAASHTMEILKEDGNYPSENPAYVKSNI